MSWKATGLCAIQEYVLKRVPASRPVLRLGNVRRTNRAVILQLLRQDEELSRADIARQSGLSEPATSRIIAGLIRDGLIFESGDEKPTGGRPGRRLQLNPDRIALGIEIDNSEMRFAFTNMRGAIVESWSLPTPTAALDAVDAVAAEVSRRRRAIGATVPGIGICMRGIVDCRAGILVQGNRPDWARIPVGSILEERLSEPIYVDNNVRAAAHAEYSFGPREVRDAHCLVFVGINEGLGATILLNGKIHYGPRMAAGEFGQMIMSSAANGESGTTLEQLAADGALCRSYSNQENAQERGVNEDCSAFAQRIARWAVEGDPVARQALEETARHLGTGIANMVWGLDADVVVIDGAVTSAWQIAGPILRERLPDVYQASGLPVILRPSALGGDAAVIGAASMPFSTVFALSDPLPMSASAYQSSAYELV
jgi:predicted NBD/HSP70 family sugar kinase